MRLIDKIAELKVVPVVKLDSAKDALPVAEALCEGGLPVAEITFRTDAAEEAIRKISADCKDILVGAGTVINVEQAKRALDAGAKFIVTPGISRSVIEFAKDNNVDIFPGACTPAEIMTALEYDLPVVKFFPAKQYGGLDTIKSLAAPFPQIKFMPTGGVNAGNILEFLAFDKIIACGGSWMVKDSFIRNGDFETIVRLTKEVMDIVK